MPARRLGDHKSAAADRGAQVALIHRAANAERQMTGSQRASSGLPVGKSDNQRLTLNL